MNLLAAVFAGALAWALSWRAMTSGKRLDGSTAGPGSSPERRRRWPEQAALQAWLSQAGADVSAGQFFAVSACSALVSFGLLLMMSRTVVVAGLPALGAAAAPYAYWAAQRRKKIAEVAAAWPDALRYLTGVLGAGMATLHDALVSLAASGPVPLRSPLSRYVRMSSRLGDRRALEVLRAELAGPVSDQVLLALEGAVEEGTGTALRVLGDLGAHITADIQLADKIRTLQAQSRAATWGCFVVPYGVLVFLCTTNAAYRAYFATSGGLAILCIGATTSLAGLAVSTKLVRPVATTKRVFAKAGPS